MKNKSQMLTTVLIVKKILVEVYFWLHPVKWYVIYMVPYPYLYRECHRIHEHGRLSHLKYIIMTSQNDVMPWKMFPHIWSFVAPVTTGGFPSQRLSTADIWCFFDVKLLNKQSSYRWYGTPWCPFDITVMNWALTHLKSTETRLFFENKY